MCCKSQGALSRLGLLWGISALIALLVAFASGSWLYTKEPVVLPNSQVSTSVTFRIGLWKVCPYLKRVNSTTHLPPTACSPVKYSGWEDVESSDLGMWTTLDLAQVFISRMRWCTILSGSAIILLLLAILFALLGYYKNDNKAVIACGFFIVAGLSLGTGLVIFVSSLSETLAEIPQYQKEYASGPMYDYRYGWCFFAAGTAFIMTNIAALLSISGYLNRFQSVDEMVRLMVPGAERKLREHQHLSGRHICPATRHYDSLPVNLPKHEAECGPLLNKTPPDVCTTNKSPDFGIEDLDPLGLMVDVTDPAYSAAQTLAGQTIPITIKGHNSIAPLSLSNLPVNKYGTIHHAGSTLHQGFLGVAELGSSSSTSSGGYFGRSKTLEHQRNKKKCVTIETFYGPEPSFSDLSNKRTNEFSFSGSAV